MVHRHFAPQFSGNSEFSRELLPSALFGEEHTRPHSDRKNVLKNGVSARSVSYTHLTLPTILLV